MQADELGVPSWEGGWNGGRREGGGRKVEW